MKKINYFFLLFFFSFNLIIAFNEIEEVSSEDEATQLEYTSLEEFDKEAIGLLISNLLIPEGLSSKKEIADLISRRKDFITAQNRRSLFKDLSDFAKAAKNNSLKSYISSLNENQRYRLKAAIVTTGSIIIFWILAHTYFHEFMQNLEPSSKLFSILATISINNASNKICQGLTIIQEKTNSLKLAGKNLCKKMIINLVKSIFSN